jgi:hypothetical protein
LQNGKTVKDFVQACLSKFTTDFNVRDNLETNKMLLQTDSNNCGAFVAHCIERMLFQNRSLGDVQNEIKHNSSAVIEYRNALAKRVGDYAREQAIKVPKKNLEHIAMEMDEVEAMDDVKAQEDIAAQHMVQSFLAEVEEPKDDDFTQE